ncbi:MAG: hypothetical protein KC466_07475 [Myxococcales bacterium]|nr:hypothetical protein [Myxococcales bacterium]
MSVVGVEFQRLSTIVPCDAGDLAALVGTRVVTEGDDGPRIGSVVVADLPSGGAAGPLARILRLADDEDLAAEARAREFADEAYDLAAEWIETLRLDMRLVTAEANLARTRARFIFTAPERVDFRRLVRELAHALGVQVQLHQVGARDAAKLLGGIGRCGEGLCCATHLRAFHPVSVKMAKDQDLGLSESSITGQCGRLKCCIAYEVDAYREGRRGLPKCGRRVETPDGAGLVVALKPLACRACVSLDADRKVREYPPDELIQIQRPATPRA